jgi:uncharacterized protein YdeI (YjbR/CyaY-like superfamily)
MDPDRFIRVEIATTRELWEWLAAHHAQSDSVWLVTWKAHLPARYVSREEVLDALIAHGWIDGRRLKLDADRTMQLISPRKQQVWAQSYKIRAVRLIAEGRMYPAGLAAMEAGQKTDGWTQIDPVDALIDPPDLMAALAASGGSVFWQTAAPSYRRNVLRWIASAKQVETRKRRLDQVASFSAQGQKVPQY